MIISGATNSNDKEGVSVEWEWVWGKGTGKQNRQVKRVMWEPHPRFALHLFRCHD